jgi:hypothetical protein
MQAFRLYAVLGIPAITGTQLPAKHDYTVIRFTQFVTSCRFIRDVFTLFMGHEGP